MLLTALFILFQLDSHQQVLINSDLQNYLKEELPAKIQYVMDQDTIDEFLNVELSKDEIDLMNSIVGGFKFLNDVDLSSYSYLQEEKGKIDYVYEIYVRKYSGFHPGSIKQKDKQLKKDFRRIKKRFDKEFTNIENGREEYPGYVLSDYHRYWLESASNLQIEINAITGGCLRRAEIILEYRINVGSKNL